LQRVVTRLLEIGILTPEQGIDAIKTGIYPNSKDIGPAQEGYVESRRKGMYNPLVGGVPTLEDELVTGQGDEGDVGQKAPGRPDGTKGTPKESNASDIYSRKEIQALVYKIEDFQNKIKDLMLKKVGAKKLSEQQEDAVAGLCRSIVLSKSKRMWTRAANACIKDFEKIEKLAVMPEIVELSDRHQVEIYAAALLHHSNSSRIDISK
jgi:hypothetical protein